MKKLLVMAMLACTIAAQAQEVNPKSKFGMELQMHLGMNVNHSKALTRGEEAPKVKVLVSLVPTSGVTAADLEAVGCEVKWAMKSVASVIVAVDQLEALAAITGVRNINLPQEVELENNKSRGVVHVEEVTDPKTAVAAGLPQGYDGTGVLVGIIDGGIDFRHYAFTDEEGNTRFQKTWTQDINDDGKFESFIAHTDSSSILSAIPIKSSSHGSHVLGIMTGRELGNNLHGMAPNAGIVAVDTKMIDDQIIEGMKLVCKYAEEINKPIAINMSIGSYGVWPDGCTPISEAMVELTDNGTKPGVIFSLSSGNYGHHEKWVTHKFTSDDEKLYVICDTVKNKPFEMEGHMVRSLNSPEHVHAWVDRVVDNKEEMLVVYDLDKKTIIEDPDTEIGVASVYITVENGEEKYHLEDIEQTYTLKPRIITLRMLRELHKKVDSYSSSIHTCADGVTQKSEMWFNINGGSFRLFKNLRLGACFSFPAGTEVRVANLASSESNGKFIQPEGFDYVKVSTCNGTLNLNTCNAANITTGNYCIRNSFTNGFNFEVVDDNLVANEVDKTSAYGYSFNEEHLAKPEVLAPGSYIESTTNNYNYDYFAKYGVLKEKIDDYSKQTVSISSYVTLDNQKYWYQFGSGTSMAAPVTTGIIALWLQANPTLSVVDVREILSHSSSAVASAYADGDEKLKCGAFGMINALEGLKYINAHMTSISNVSDSQQNDDASPVYNLFGQPTQGQGFVVKGGRVVFVK